MEFLASSVLSMSLLDAAKTVNASMMTRHSSQFFRYKDLYRHPHTIHTLAAAHVFKQVTGTHPSKVHLVQVCSQLLDNNILTFPVIYSVMVEQIPILRFFPDARARDGCDAYFNSLMQKDVAFIKSEIAGFLHSQYCCHDVIKPGERLLCYFKRIMQAHDLAQYFEYESQYISHHGLIQKCPLTDATMSCTMPWRTLGLCRLDALRFSCHENNYLSLLCLNKTVIMLPAAYGHWYEDLKKDLPSVVVFTESRHSNSHGTVDELQKMYIHCLPPPLYAAFHHADHFWCDVAMPMMLRKWLLREVAAGSYTRWSHYVVNMFARGGTPHYATRQAASHCVVMIDNRCNIISALSAFITGQNLASGTWHLVLFTTPDCAAFYTQVLGCIGITSDQCTIHTSLRHLCIPCSCFSIEDYNKVLKDAEMWSVLADMGFNKALIIQDDGMLVRPGVEQAYLGYDYVGAPWVPAAELLLKGNPQLVGNGGMSLRDIKLHLKITVEETSASKNQLFNNNSQPIPEDVFFANKVPQYGGKVPTYQVASAFSSEQVLTLNSLGFHKVWAYHSKQDVDAWFRRI